MDIKEAMNIQRMNRGAEGTQREHGYVNVSPNVDKSLSIFNISIIFEHANIWEEIHVLS